MPEWDQVRLLFNSMLLQGAIDIWCKPDYGLSAYRSSRMAGVVLGTDVRYALNTSVRLDAGLAWWIQSTYIAYSGI